MCTLLISSKLNFCAYVYFVNTTKEIELYIYNVSDISCITKYFTSSVNVSKIDIVPLNQRKNHYRNINWLAF